MIVEKINARVDLQTLKTCAGVVLWAPTCTNARIAHDRAEQKGKHLQFPFCRHPTVVRYPDRTLQGNYCELQCSRWQGEQTGVGAKGGIQDGRDLNNKMSLARTKPMS